MLSELKSLLPEEEAAELIRQMQGSHSEEEAKRLLAHVSKRLVEEAAAVQQPAPSPDIEEEIARIGVD